MHVHLEVLGAGGGIPAGQGRDGLCSSPAARAAAHSQRGWMFPRERLKALANRSSETLCQFQLFLFLPRGSSCRMLFALSYAKLPSSLADLEAHRST